MRTGLTRGGRELHLDGEVYTHTLASLHLALRPTSYFEIGTLHGQTLRLAGCPAVAVDPNFQLAPDLAGGRPAWRLFEQTSDAFFADNDLRALLGGPVGLAFLDGMHQFDFLLRDFINTERACGEASVVLMHDGLPRDAAMTGAADATAASRFPGYWTGDVWKLIPILRRWRPDLEVVGLDAQPTGLIAVTGLAPENRTLSDHYDAIVAEWEPVSLAAYGLDRLFAEARVQPARDWRRRFGPEEAPNEPIGWKRRLRRLLPV
ncbi:hypothetical protein ASD89_22825 [Caulobacter sp. Root656]|nr:hypothetical protein ASD89_22825 [Caulobacter sp. Root656]